MKNRTIIPIILSVIALISIPLLCSWSYISYTKSILEKETEKKLSFDSFLILKGPKVGFLFKDDNSFINIKYCYSIPDGNMYTQFFGSDLMIRLNSK